MAGRAYGAILQNGEIRLARETTASTERGELPPLMITREEAAQKPKPPELLAQRRRFSPRRDTAPGQKRIRHRSGWSWRRDDSVPGQRNGDHTAFEQAVDPERDGQRLWSHRVQCEEPWLSK